VGEARSASRLYQEPPELVAGLKSKRHLLIFTVVTAQEFWRLMISPSGFLHHGKSALMDRKGYMPLPQAPGLGVVIKKESMQA
jgi:L-alanine-DL-glutamate epimerase-like enolase superfamily enzyme